MRQISLKLRSILLNTFTTAQTKTATDIIAMRPLRAMESFDAASDLLVIVDDAALDVGRVRFRPEGGAGGHNGLKSISGALQSNEFARCLGHKI